MPINPNNSMNPGSSSSDDLSQYRQVYIDECEEELDALVDAILKLEGDPRNADALNKAFRMLHSLKGSSGMMGFEVIGSLAHELEDRFERYRSGADVVDRETTTLMLQCVDFFKTFIGRLRGGDATEGDASSLSQRLRELDARRNSVSQPRSIGGGTPSVALGVSIGGGIRVKIRFRPGLQLADLKARLIVTRLSAIGEVIACEPSVDDIQSFEDLPLFSLTILTDREIEQVRRIASVDGVEAVEIVGEPSAAPPRATAGPLRAGDSGLAASEVRTAPAARESIQAEVVRRQDLSIALERTSVTKEIAAEHQAPDERSQVSETLRIGIDRLDHLMNLTGELVVANARFAQITAAMSPIFRKPAVFGKSKDLTQRIRRRFDWVREHLSEEVRGMGGWNQIFEGLDDELEGLDGQSSLWSEGHQRFSEISEAIDQLTRVSKNLQRGVLNTRMVPIGPLFNRFKRVVRDLSVERRKQVQLAISGEKTELDKRMIDALGDPLLHLVRNSIDHGIETPDERRAANKPEAGTIVLEAAHRGNNVLITVRDDGAGIDVDRVRARILEQGLASEAQLREMSEQQIIDHIWQPGFSTARQITEVSGRGVGMDIVRNSIADLSGTIDVATARGLGTVFTIRMPLTLAIIHSLLIRFRDDCFSIPIDDVRMIVSVPPDQVHAVQRHSTIDVRGELIPLVRMDGIFEWNGSPAARENQSPSSQNGAAGATINVVVLQSRGKTLGLCVDALVGRGDVVIKPLAENFLPVRGLSGASIMGDGAVCLMLDSTAMIELAAERSLARAAK
ncbi:MAG TPA: chemotaxis protein CheA [Planctomycetaceae bacterium]|nr:chemotaxis protein CheA [Planctomycetaceae bacterium]